MGKAKIQPQTYTAVKYSLGARPLPAHSNSGRQPQTCAKYALFEPVYLSQQASENNVPMPLYTD